MQQRIKLFEDEPALPLTGLYSLSEPDPGEVVDDVSNRVRAIIDIPLIGPTHSGKSELAAVLLRSLKARAPNLPRAETQSNRVALRTIMGGGTSNGNASDSEVVPHYTFRVSVTALLAMLSPSQRALLLFRCGRIHLPLGILAIGIAVGFAVGWLLSAAFAVLTATATAMMIAVTSIRAVREAEVNAARNGDIEIVIWDPSGESFAPERAAETYDFLAHLARRRRQTQPPWRGYAFVPALVINPIDYGQVERRRVATRLRGLLPMFAALGGERPRAVVAISRWNLVANACPSGSSKDEDVSVSIVDRDGETSTYQLPREALASDLVETEDGNEGGVHVRYLRYEAAANADVNFADDTLHYRGIGCGACFVGQSQRSLVHLLAELALSPRGLDQLRSVSNDLSSDENADLEQSFIDDSHSARPGQPRPPGQEKPFESSPPPIVPHYKNSTDHASYNSRYYNEPYDINRYRRPTDVAEHKITSNDHSLQSTTQPTAGHTTLIGPNPDVQSAVISTAGKTSPGYDAPSNYAPSKEHARETLDAMTHALGHSQ